MWKSFENIGLQTSEKVSWEKKKKETCAKHKIDRSQNGRSNYQLFRHASKTQPLTVDVYTKYMYTLKSSQG